MTAATRRRARRDPMLGHNEHVLAYAKANRLRTEVREDGETVLRCGRRDRTAHVSVGLRADTSLWTVFVGAMTGRATTFLAGRLRAAGALRVVELDGELFGDILETDLARVLSCSPRTSLRPRRELSPEQRAAASERLARNRPASRRNDEDGGGFPAPPASGRLSGPREDTAPALPPVGEATP